MGTRAPLPALCLLLVLGATAAVYLPILENDFVNFDDPSLITENPLVTSLSWQSVAGAFSSKLFTPHYKPLVYLTWMVEHGLAGPRPLVFHLDNLLLHLANCALVFLVLLRLGRLTGLSPRTGLLLATSSALFFGVHPLHTESVAWASERKDVLSALFYLLATLTYVSFVRSGFERRHLPWASAGFYLAAVLSKSVAVTFAAVPFLIDALVRRRPRVALRDKAPFLVVALVASILYGLFAGGLGAAARPQGEASALLVANFRLLAFAGHLLVPVRQSVIYPGEPLLAELGAWLAALPVVTLLLVLALLRWRERGRWVLFGSLFFVVALLPALAVPARGSNFLPDRYTYLPSIGLFACGSFLVLHLVGARRWKTAAALLGAVAVVWGVLGFQRCFTWRDSGTLWSDAIRKYPRQIPVAYINRGNFRFETGRLAQALEDYEVALELSPDNAWAHKNRGAVLARTGDLAAALEAFDTAIRLEPRLPDTYLQRGMARTLLGRFAEAEADLRRYVSMRPRDAKGHYWRGLVRQAERRHAEAIREFGRALELDPRDPRFREALARSRAAQSLQLDSN